MTRNRRLLLAVALAAPLFSVAALAPHAAWAQPIPSSPIEARKQAKLLFEQGADAFTKGNYDLAVQCWTRSYDLSHEPVIQQQLALAYGHLGKAKEERQALQNWRAVAPPEERPILDQQIANLDARIAKQEADERKRAEDDARLKQQLEDEQKKPRGRTGPPVSIPGIAIGSAGVAAVIAGVVVDGVAASTRPDPAEACKADGAKQLCLESAKDDIDRGNTMAIAGDITWIVGAAAIAAGVVVIIIDRPKTARATQPAAPPAQPSAVPTADHASHASGIAGLEAVPFAVRDASGSGIPGLALRGEFF